VTICAIAAGIVLTLPLPAAPQQTGKLVRIGCLSAASEAAAIPPSLLLRADRVLD